MSDMSHANAALAGDDCLWPEWRVSPRVRALVTTRNGGVSVAPYGGGRPGEAGHTMLYCELTVMLDDTNFSKHSMST